MRPARCAFVTLAVLVWSAGAFSDDTFERALSLASEQRDSEARKVLDSVLRRDPGHRRARLLNGILRVREGRVEEAIGIFEALRRDHPDLSEPYNNLAVLYAVRGRFEDARKMLLDALEREPDAVMYSNLGDIYTRLARRAYENAEALESGRGDARPGMRMDGAVGTVGTVALPAPAAGDPKTGESAGAPSDGADEARPSPPVSRDTATETGERQAATPADAGQDAAGRGATVGPGARDGGESSRDRPACPGAPECAGGLVDVRRFCARTEGFEDRRSTDAAAAWLRSIGAEVLEVRSGERQVPEVHRVYLPPFASFGEAKAKTREIRGRGVKDVAAIREGPLANGISFGVYGKPGNMRRRVAALGRLGYPVQSRTEGVRTVEEHVITTRAAGAPAMLKAAWASRFPDRALELVDCG